MKRVKPKLLFVGAFPKENNKVFGGNVTDCRLLLSSSFPERFELVLIDSTQATNPPPHFFTRLKLAIRRVCLFLYKMETEKPDMALYFLSAGASMIEKGIMANYSSIRGVKTYMFPRGGKIMLDAASSKWKSKLSFCMFYGADKVFCQGDEWCLFAREILRKTEEQVAIIENWAATPELIKIGEKRKENEHRKSLIILFVGWLEKAKGVWELLESFKELSMKYDCRLTFVGDGNERNKLEREVQHLGLQNKVNFSGWLKERELALVYEESDIFVLPSYVEGFPNSVVEAMSAKLPVVVSSVGAIPSVLTDQKNSLLVKPGNVGSLVQALDKLLGNQELRDHLSVSGYQLAKNKWMPEQAVKAFFNHLKC